jgi:hypothetical protein
MVRYRGPVLHPDVLTMVTYQLEDRATIKALNSTGSAFGRPKDVVAR